MGRHSKRKALALRAQPLAAAARTLTEEEVLMHATAPPLSLRAPRQFAVDRGDRASTMKIKANQAWRFVRDNFHEAPLEEKQGNYNRPDDDYGGLGAIMTIHPRDQNPVGFKFMGTPSCKKPGQSKHFIPSSHRPCTELIAAVLQSLAATPDMQLLEPRVGFFRGIAADWHSDANTRGSHPNAMRCLDPGGGLLLYTGVDFHCSLLWFEEQWVVPWDINPVDFRYMGWDAEGTAVIHTVEATRFWQQVVAAPDGPIVAGLLEVAIIDVKDGIARATPMDYTHWCTSSKELEPFTFPQLESQALRQPWRPPATPWSMIGVDPKVWHVFYGWRHMHAWVGDPWVRRVHVIGCPLRQNLMGQLRSVTKAPVSAPMDPQLQSLRELTVGTWVHVAGRGLGEVMEIEDALDAQDVKVLVRYEPDTFLSERLGQIAWEADEVPGMCKPKY